MPSSTGIVGKSGTDTLDKSGTVIFDKSGTGTFGAFENIDLTLGILIESSNGTFSLTQGTQQNISQEKILKKKFRIRRTMGKIWTARDLTAKL